MSKTRTLSKAELPEHLQSLAGRFDVVDFDDADYKVTCQVCERAWLLAKSSRAVGNVLTLLNHARAHENRKKQGR